LELRELEDQVQADERSGTLDSLPEDFDLVEDTELPILLHRPGDRSSVELLAQTRSELHHLSSQWSLYSASIHDDESEPLAERRISCVLDEQSVRISVLLEVLQEKFGLDVRSVQQHTKTRRQVQP
jgi:hypothetical protein